ncbi:MAG: LuxR C-terminal-related transcriptional regulator [Anaerolineae bacterium]
MISKRDFANVRLAWHWAAGQHNSDLINLMLEALNFYADMRARFVEGAKSYSKLRLTILLISTMTRRNSLIIACGCGVLARIILGSLVDTGERSELATEIKSIGKALEPFSSSADTAFSLLQTGMTLFLQEKYVDTRTYLEQAMQLYEQIDDPFYLADTINFVGLTNPEPEEVLDSYRRSLAIQQHIGDKNGIGWTLSHLARVSYLLHRYADGENYARQAIALQRQRNDRKGLSFSMIVGCLWAFRRGEWEEALEMAEEGLKLAQNLNISFFLKSALANLGLILIITEVDFERGEALCLQVNNEDINYIATATEAYSDALNGLVISNYMRGDAEATQRYFHNIPGSIQHKWGSITLMDRLYSVLSGILVLDMQGKTELALEVTALALTLPDPPGVVPLVWFRNWALIQRLCQRWRQELGDERYEAAWQRGARRDVPATIELLISGLDGAEVAPPPLPVTEPSTVQLTEREQEILGLLAAGLSNREIAAKLVFSLGTVKWYANQIYGKLGVGSRTQAIARARELHILS